MSFSHSWIAVHGLKEEQALAALGMKVARVASSPDDIHDWSDVILLGQTEEGSLFVLSSDEDDAIHGALAGLAELGPATAFQVNDSVMYSEARGYEAGKEIWRVVHDPDKGKSVHALEISGTIPAQLNAIILDARAAQDAEGGHKANVDYMFEIPGEFSQTLCGYKPGEGEPEDLVYSILEPIDGGPASAARGPRREPSKSRPGFFARLFGNS